MSLNYDQELDQYIIIDSLPMLLCQPIRKRRAKVFCGLANIGYNSTKKLYYYYGVKDSFVVTQDGYVYVITKASIYTTKEAEKLILNIQCYVLDDEGYIGKRLHDELKINGYVLWKSY